MELVPLLTPAEFDFAIGSTVGALAQAGADGILINVPDVTSIAFLNTVPYNAVPLDQATADMLNQVHSLFIMEAYNWFK